MSIKINGKRRDHYEYRHMLVPSVPGKGHLNELNAAAKEGWRPIEKLADAQLEIGQMVDAQGRKQVIPGAVWLLERKVVRSRS